MVKSGNLPGMTVATVDPLKAYRDSIGIRDPLK